MRRVAASFPGATWSLLACHPWPGLPPPCSSVAVVLESARAGAWDCPGKRVTQAPPLPFIGSILLRCVRWVGRASVNQTLEKDVERKSTFWEAGRGQDSSLGSLASGESWILQCSSEDEQKPHETCPSRLTVTLRLPWLRLKCSSGLKSLHHQVSCYRKG